MGYGASQSGIYLRDFIHEGFNEDEQGQRVFDGLDIHIAGGHKLFLNSRFAQPLATGPFQHAVRHGPDTNFPRTYAIRENPLDPQKPDGILKRPATDPKIFHTVTALEYWQLRASLVHTDEDGTVDLIQPDNVREYLFSSMQHVPGSPSTRGIGNRQCQQFSNPLHYGALLRALLVALDNWVRDGTPPPAGRAPRIDEGTLIGPDQYCAQSPSIPSVKCNGFLNASGERDFGPRVRGNRGVIDKLIPDVLSIHRVLVPRVDEIGAVR